MKLNINKIQKEILDEPFDCLKRNISLKVKKEYELEKKINQEVEELDERFLRAIA